jgi:uncharacterized protein
LAERGSFGMPIAVDSTNERAIARSSTGITAFIGRTLKGPLDLPVRIASIGDYQRIFGGLWQPSTLSYAVEQYFDSGGHSAVVVRVANGARAPTLSLSAGTSELHLVGVNPGSREYLRAAVDYDGVAEPDVDCFNLVLQRLRLPGSEHIEDQEIFRAVSIECLRDLLLHSRLMRVAGAVPPSRPDRTSSGSERAVSYVSSRFDGDDGAPLSDYDVIGSAVDCTGLFALRPEEQFDLLCVPPLSREQDAGPATLLVAARLCRERHAMLVVDPPAQWRSPAEALAGARTWPFRSENAAMFFPRISAFDRLRNRMETFGSAAAAAGMLSRADHALPVWAPAEAEEPILRTGMKLTAALSDSERAKLAQAGINTLQSVRSSGRDRIPLCTLAPSGSPDWRYLAERRLALFVLASIERGTHWLCSATSNPATWARAQAEVEHFLEELDREGAFAGSRPEESYLVICDERVNRAETVAEGKTHLLFGIATAKPGVFHTWMIAYHRGVSRARAVAVNPLATARQPVPV